MWNPCPIADTLSFLQLMWDPCQRPIADTFFFLQSMWDPCQIYPLGPTSMWDPCQILSFGANVDVGPLPNLPFGVSVLIGSIANTLPFLQLMWDPCQIYPLGQTLNFSLTHFKAFRGSTNTPFSRVGNLSLTDPF